MPGRRTLWYRRDDEHALPHTPHWTRPLSKYRVTGWQYRSLCERSRSWTVSKSSRETMAGTATAIQSAQSGNIHLPLKTLWASPAVRRGRDPIEIADARICFVLEHGLDLAPIPVGATEARADLTLFQEAGDVHEPKFTARKHLKDRAYHGGLLVVHYQRSGGRG